MHSTGSVTVGAMAQSGEGTDWRLIYVSDPSSMTNYDFDPGHARPLITTQPTTVEELRQVVDNIALSGADTLIQEVYNAAWTMYFRSERFEYDARPQHRRFIPLMDEGTMPLQVLLEQARARGMHFMAGFRMNDSHGAPDQGGMFLHTHPQWKLTEMPDGAAFVPGNRMDFSFDGVRDYLYGIMEEVVDRFDVDGLELTFREGLYFPAPHGDRSIGRARQPLMTGLIERVRALLDQRGADRGRRLQLGVRVPQTIAECHDVGLDVPAWIAAGLVDYVAPMDAMYSDFNPAYQEFSSLAAGSSCRFYPGVLPYCSHRDRAGLPLSLDNYRALVHTLRRQGADGISIYNYQMHWDGFRSTGRDNGSETMYPTALAHLRELADLERVARGPPPLPVPLHVGRFPGVPSGRRHLQRGAARSRDSAAAWRRGSLRQLPVPPLRGHRRGGPRAAPLPRRGIGSRRSPRGGVERYADHRPAPAPHLAPRRARRLTRPSAGRLYELHVRPGARLDGRWRQSAYGHLAGRPAGRVADRRGGGDGNPGLTGSAVHCLPWAGALSSTSRSIGKRAGTRRIPT